MRAFGWLGLCAVLAAVGCGSTSKDEGGASGSSDSGSQGGNGGSGTGTTDPSSSNDASNSSSSNSSSSDGTGGNDSGAEGNTTSDTAGGDGSGGSGGNLMDSGAEGGISTTSADGSTGSGGAGGTAATTVAVTTTGAGGSGGSSAECPDVPPSDGSDCGSAQQICGYEDCDGAGRTVAGCFNGTWSVAVGSCSESTFCQGGAGGESCGYGQVCLVLAGGALSQTCVENTCGDGPIGCDCIEGCFGVCGVLGDASYGITISCNTCPQGGCA